MRAVSHPLRRHIGLISEIADQTWKATWLTHATCTQDRGVTRLKINPEAIEALNEPNAPETFRPDPTDTAERPHAQSEEAVDGLSDEAFSVLDQSPSARELDLNYR